MLRRKRNIATEGSLRRERASVVGESGVDGNQLFVRQRCDGPFFVLVWED